MYYNEISIHATHPQPSHTYKCNIMSSLELVWFKGMCTGTDMLFPCCTGIIIIKHTLCSLDIQVVLV